MPDTLAGVFEFRRETIPLINLRQCLRFPETRTQDLFEEKVIVMEFNRLVNGFLVDDVRRLHRISWSDIEPPTLISGSGEDPYIVGMVKLENTICALIDFEKIVSTMNPDASIKHVSLPFKKYRKFIKILFAEDSHFVRQDVYNILSDAGYQVTAVKNGQEALNILKECEQKCMAEKVPINKYYNIVLTDIEMPKMDGRHLTKQIKESRILKELPVFLFTSMSGMWGEVKASKIGAQGLFSKPDIISAVDSFEKYALPPYDQN